MNRADSRGVHILPIPMVFLWIGFICAISFMEAWLKFRAPGVTLPIGLGIGSLVFHALNKVEWFLSLGMLLIFSYRRPYFANRDFLLLGVALSMLIVQTLWLLPALDERVLMYIKGEVTTKSLLHVYYLLSEVVKLFTLVVLGVRLLRIKYFKMN